MNGSWVEVSKSALVHNVKQFRKFVPDKKIMAVVKSDAYGHGLIETSKVLHKAGVDWFGVDSIDEAIQLRGVGLNNPILVLGYVSRKQVQKAIDHKISFVSYDASVVRNKWNKKPSVHIKVDTGMSRQGIMTEDVTEYIKKISEFVELEGLATHFANADDIHDRSYFNKQLNEFGELIEELEKNNIHIPVKHAFNTPAILIHNEDSFDVLRLGIGLYGLWPSLEFKKRVNGVNLKPVLSWKTKVVQVKEIKKGTAVGYGITEKVNTDTKIAVLPIGYYDGFDRRNSSVGEVVVRGKRARVLGRVSMNLTVVDVSKIKGVKRGDVVTLIGKGMTAEEAAQKIGTISYEVISRISCKIERRCR